MKKRDVKSKVKQEVKTIKTDYDQQEAPLRLNFSKFVADERKKAVMEMARTKLHHSTDDSLFKVFQAMSELDQDAHGHQLASQDIKPKLHGFTANTIQSLKKASLNLTENQVSDALQALHADQCNFVTKVGIEQGLGKYAVNWQSAFVCLQQMLVEKYVEQTYGPHHVRIVRIMKAKGFLEEKELTKFSLLPQRNLRSILAKLMSDSIVQMQDVPQSLRQSSHGPMFGLSFQGKSALNVYRTRVEHAILNLLVKDRKLGAMHNLCLEMNHLNF